MVFNTHFSLVSLSQVFVTEGKWTFGIKVSTLWKLSSVYISMFSLEIFPPIDFYAYYETHSDPWEQLGLSGLTVSVL